MEAWKRLPCASVHGVYTSQTVCMNAALLHRADFAGKVGTIVCLRADLFMCQRLQVPTLFPGKVEICTFTRTAGCIIVGLGMPQGSL